MNLQSIKEKLADAAHFIKEKAVTIALAIKKTVSKLFKKIARFCKRNPLIAIAIGGVLVIAFVVIFVIARVRGFVNKVDTGAVAGLDDTNPIGENLDNIMPLTDSNGYKVEQDIKNILILGNDPFALDNDKSTGLAAMLSDKTGVNIINCALEGTYVACKNPEYSSGEPLDLYTPYYLCTLLVHPDVMYDRYLEAAETYSDELPYNATNVARTLANLDPSTIDVIVFMYDLNDYWIGSNCINNLDDYDHTTFCGNLMSSYFILDQSYKNIRQIYSSPYFNYMVGEDGTYSNPELITGQTSPSDYILLMDHVVSGLMAETFLDNYFNSINEDNASDYLADDRHLNAAGKQLLVDRLDYAIYYFVRNTSE